MLTEELIELANKICKQKAEEQTTELKPAHIDRPKKLYDTLSSFSNQDSGGILVFDAFSKMALDCINPCGMKHHAPQTSLLVAAGLASHRIQPHRTE